MVSLIKSPWFKGKFGEFLVNLSARRFLDKSRYPGTLASPLTKGSMSKRGLREMRKR
ncbi:hypothetical protein [Marinobacter vulgaris]|uniref:hypothetical protein n=1 Tax=Marinobacter vulgaris TaxID=1928331 RepID=UPI001D0D8BE2|nr:hypothetical protein [Marinobacter vulgaris]